MKTLIAVFALSTAVACGQSVNLESVPWQVFGFKPGKATVFRNVKITAVGPAEIRVVADEGLFTLCPLLLNATLMSELGYTRESVIRASWKSLGETKKSAPRSEIRSIGEGPARVKIEGTIKLVDRFERGFAGAQKYVSAFEIWDGTGFILAYAPTDKIALLISQISDSGELNGEFEVARQPAFNFAPAAGQTTACFHLVKVFPSKVLSDSRFGAITCEVSCQ